MFDCALIRYAKITVCCLPSRLFTCAALLLRARTGNKQRSANPETHQPAAELSHGCCGGVTQRFVTGPRRRAQTPETRRIDAKISPFTEEKSRWGGRGVSVAGR